MTRKVISDKVFCSQKASKGIEGGKMVYALARVTFKDFETWKAEFTAAAELREEFGSKGWTVFRSPDKPNQVWILGEYEELARAKDIWNMRRLEDALKRASVTTKPEVTYLDVVMKVPV